MTDYEKQIEKDKEQLKHLQEEIDEVKAETTEKEQEHFYDAGTIGTDKVDDTIVPPG